MNVAEIMTQSVQACRSNDSLQRAAQLMWEHDCGCLPVCALADGTEHIVGVITDRDICMRALFSGMPLRELQVQDAMAKQVLTCRPGDTLEHAEKVMRGGRVRRLPVISEAGALAGLISLADLAQEAVRESVSSRKALADMDVADTLAAICTRPISAEFASATS
jgi:CBS-domain-containing membrane protein